MKKITFLMLFTLISHFSWAQSRTITGTVSDSKTKETLPGASIQVKGTSKGAATDMDGNFSIKDVSETDTLVVTYMGYQSLKVAVGTSEKLNILLKSDSKVMEEVVVIGYATVNTRDVTGAVSSVKATQLKDIPVTDATQALTGRLGGVQVTTGEGGPGANVNIKIRGGGSISQDNSPIYIVDGMQLDNALSTLNPQDIESIDVLKDASATAIYGARGANGVVIITTKSGKAGKTTISFNSAVGMRKLSSKLEVLSPYEFVLWNYERSRISLNAGDAASFDKEYGSTWDTLNVYKDVAAIDWQDRVFGRNAMYYNNNVTVTGGSEKMTYSLSLTNNVEEGIMLQSNFDRNLVNFKMDAKPAEKLKIGANARYMLQHINGAGTSSQNGSSRSRLKPTIKYQPFATSSTPDLNEYDPDYSTDRSIVNPVVLTEAEYQKKSQDAINLNGYASYDIIKNLSFKTSLGYNLNLTREDNFFSKITSRAFQLSSLPVAKIANKSVSTLNNSNVLIYSKKGIREHHNLDILLGEETFATKSIGFNLESRYLPAEITADKAFANMSLGDVAAGQQIQPTTPTAESTLLSYFGRVSYSFKDKYLFSYSSRADGSSKFAEHNRWGYFHAGAFSWRFINEKFWKIPEYINDGKLRLSYGLSGNNRIADFLYIPFYVSNPNRGSYAVGNSVNTAFSPDNLPNNNLKWETTFSRNAGLDLSFLNNRIQFSFDYYYNSVEDLLVEIDIPKSSGYSTQIQNIGSTSNQGVELQLGSTIIEKKDFTWSVNFNISHNQNKVVDLGPITSKKLISGWQNNLDEDYIVEVGKPIGQMYGYVTDGFYKVEDFTYNETTKVYTLKPGIVSGTIFGAPKPGSIKFQDLNGDGIITDQYDKTIVGNANPAFIGGLNNQFSYKNFDLSIFLNWVYGNDVFNANKVEFNEGSSLKTNLTAEMQDRWRNINAQGQVVTDPIELAALNANAKIWSPVTNNRYFLHSYAVEDGSFLRVNNITLGYTLPDNLIKKAKLSKFRIYATVNNIATFTNYTGYDPEANTRTDIPMTPGVDYSAYPRTRTYVAGINVTF